VSVERIVSGPGLRHIFDYLVSVGGSPDPDVAELIDKQDSAAVISEAGRSGRCPVSAEAVDLFASILGGVAGNLALAATGIGLGTCQIGALFDDEVNEIIGVDGKSESVVYMTVIGYPAK